MIIINKSYKCEDYILVSYSHFAGRTQRRKLVNPSMQTLHHKLLKLVRLAVCNAKEKIQQGISSHFVLLFGGNTFQPVNPLLGLVALFVQIFHIYYPPKQTLFGQLKVIYWFSNHSQQLGTVTDHLCGKKETKEH